MPDVEEMAEIMHLSLRKAKIINQIVNLLSSTKDTAGPDPTDEEQTIEAVLEDTHATLPEEEIGADEEKRKVLRLLDEIDPREAEVLRLHYGLNGRKAMTLKEIGAKLGLTRERIRQIQRHALTRLFEYMHP